MPARNAGRQTAAGRSASPKYARKRDEVVDIAARLIIEQGVSGMSLGEVSARMGLVPTGVFYYFKKKEALASACFLKAIHTIEGHFSAPEDLPEAVRLDHALAAHFAFAKAVAEGEAAPVVSFNDMRQLADPALDEAFGAMFRHVRGHCFPRSAAPFGRIERSARTFLLLTEIVWTPVMLVRSETADYLRVKDRLRDVLLNGFAAAPEGWRFPERPPAAPVAETSGARTREDFLKAATRLINEQGCSGASVERICAAVNVTKGAFYHYIEAKDDLVADCFNRTIDHIIQALVDGERREADALNALASAAAFLVERQLDGTTPLLHPFALASTPPALQAQVKLRFDRVIARISSMICDGFADGSIRPMDAYVAAHALLALIVAAPDLRGLVPEAAADNVADLFLRPLFLGLFSQEG